METWKTVLIDSAIFVAIGWIAVFICGLIDRLRGYPEPEFVEGEKDKLPPKTPRPWWHHVLLLPFYAVFVVLMVVLGIFFIPPMVVLGRGAKVKMIFRRGWVVKRHYVPITRTPDTPSRTVTDYTADEVARYQASYRLLVAEYRRSERNAYYFVLAFLLCMPVGMLAPKSVSLFIYVGIAGIFLAFGTVFFLLSYSRMHVPRCPACGHAPDRGFGMFCPECGGRTLELDDSRRSGAPHCRSCGKNLVSGEERWYKIRACTHCGLMLDEKGL